MPAVAAAICEAGGLGLLCAGFRSTAELRDDLAAARRLTERPLGVELVVAGGYAADPARFAAYALRLAGEGDAFRAPVDAPRFDDDALRAKVAALVDEPVAVATVTAGAPPAWILDDLHAAGVEVWPTVTSSGDAQQAIAGGADALITALPHASLSRPPVVAAGPIATGPELAAALAGGATAVRIVAGADDPEAVLAEVRRLLAAMPASLAGRDPGARHAAPGAS